MSLEGPRVKPSRPGPPLVNPGEKTELWMTDAPANAKTMIHGAGK
jgi:hypothetical protein